MWLVSAAVRRAHRLLLQPSSHESMGTKRVKSARTESSALRAGIAAALGVVYPTLIWLLPAALIVLAASASGGFARAGLCVIAPFLYAAGFVLTAAGLARLHARHVVPGRFVRDTGTKAYFHRRLYGQC